MSTPARFGTAEMARVLGDITNLQPEPRGSTNHTADLDVGMVAQSSQAEGHEIGATGWVVKKAYDYESYLITDEDGVGANSKVNRDGIVDGQWASAAAKYEWDEDYGDVGPENPVLEAQLFDDDTLSRVGRQIEALQHIEVSLASVDLIVRIKRFEDAGLHPVMMKNIGLCHYTEPTPIQAYCIPAVMSGHDVIACAQTGSGKTAAYLIPVLSKLMGKAKRLAAARPKASTFNPDTDRVRAEPLVVIIAPTRELAVQIFNECRRFCYRSMLRPCVVYGGVPNRSQAEELARGCDILVGTPGRLRDFMNRPHIMSMQRLKYTIIDEADEMLTDDWTEELEQILSGGGITNSDADRVFMLFSATFPKHARVKAKEIAAKDHVFIKVGRTGSTTNNIHQKVIQVTEESKRQCLFDLITTSPPTRTLVFVNSKRTADFLDDFFFNADYPSTSFHADRTQREREDALRAFRNGKTPIMIATGISARGLDVANVMHVINYDLPSADHGGINEYIHRIGRCGRIGHQGIASSFWNSERNEDIAEDLCKIMLETHQMIPEFLQRFIPEGASEGLDFADASDDEEDNNGDDGGFGDFGADDTTAAADAGNDDWGVPEDAAPVSAKW